MKKSIILGLMLATTAVNAPLVHAASPSVVGNWNVTFYLEPLRSTGATQCIVFKQVPGTVGGIPTSGTWSSPTFPGWFGQWVQLGDHVRWFGVTSALATTESGNMVNRNIFGGVSFNHFTKSNAISSSAGNWFAVRTSQCRVGVASFGVSSDPATDPNNPAKKE